VSLNQAALRIAEPLAARAAALGIVCHAIGGARVIDCGVAAPGGLDAGLAMAHAALAGLGRVAVVPAGGAGLGAAWRDCPWPVVTVASEEPVAACLAAQYAGWKVSAEGYFAMASGPLRAAIGREEIFDAIGRRERPDVAVGILEASALPPAEVCRSLAAAAGVQPDRLTLLVARTASPAGMLQVVARSLETALHKLHDLGFDLSRVQRGHGAAPLAAVPLDAGRPDDLVAIGLTNDAILYGGHVVLEVAGPEADLVAIGPRMVSRASPSCGEPFLALFERAGRDFYALDPALFAPALVDLVSVATGRTHRFGGLDAALVARSFGGPPDAA
jgi:methenyltetrahydromethanopterin cyclohydrolase